MTDESRGAIGAFAEELASLVQKHRVFLMPCFGQIGLKHLPESEYLGFAVDDEALVYTGGVQSKVRVGMPFLSIDRKDPPEPEPEPFARGKAPLIAGDIAPYACPVTGRMVDGRADHKENLKRTGSRILEKGEIDEYRREKPKRDAENISRVVDESLGKIAKDFDV